MVLFVAFLSVLSLAAQEEGVIQAKMIVNGYFFKDDIKLPENAPPDVTLVNDGQKNRLIAYTYDMTLPEELVNTKMVKELTINFNREARPGETVGLWHAVDADGAHIVEGRVDDRQVFIERLLFL